jgi:hypothetical protein
MEHHKIHNVLQLQALETPAVYNWVTDSPLKLHFSCYVLVLNAILCF